jgi:5-(carboxyamino)imidazole ribonucleotide mutase
MKVLVLMGSESDWPVMREATEALAHFEIPFDAQVVSAHRTPEKMLETATTAQELGYRVIIAGAGGAAHLPGMIAAITELPVIGVPVAIGSLQGQDALLSIVQMPKGVPVATVAIGGAWNAGVLAAQILSVDSTDFGLKLRAKIKTYKESLKEKVNQAELK